MAKKMIVAKPCGTRVLDYQKDWFMINYYILEKYLGKSWKWYEKLFWKSIYKIMDVKCLIVNGLRDLFRG